MKISILVPDLSDNCLGRAYILAKILKRKYDVEIVGPMFGKGIWGPVTGDKDIKYKCIKFNKTIISIFKIGQFCRHIDGDIIYTVKPLFNSFGIGILKKLKSNKPLILDIDDWQEGFINDYYRGSFFKYLKYFIKSLIFPFDISSHWNDLSGRKFLHFADDVTVSSSFLQKKYGGTVVRHVRDTGFFNPANFDKNLLRQKYGIKEKDKIVMFFGTPRPHKGIEDLVEAFSLIKREDIGLVIAGVDRRDRYSRYIVKKAEDKLRGKIKIFGLQPFEKVPEFLSIADVIVIPQKRSDSTIGQVPAKLFDAMAMAKPIIATAVSDIPEILSGCGWVIEPGDVEKLSRAIQHAIDNPEEAEKIGIEARKRCMEICDRDMAETSLEKIFKKNFERGGPVNSGDIV
jgi:glycosyltransferase involved in cell wall biosynthesis